MNIFKKILVIVIAGLMFIPLGVKAEEKTYTSLNFDQALTDEEIEHDFSNYSENDDQAIVYLFRGKGCGYCRKFLTFLNSIVDDYGKYFKVVSYEVWGNENNKELFDRASATMKIEAGGVPYIIIGDKVFTGYHEDYEEDMKSAIKKLYNTDKADRYDVMDNLVDASEVQTTGEDGGSDGQLTTTGSKDSSSNFSLIVFYIIFTLAACTVVVVYENKKRIELENRILLLEGKKPKSNEE